MAQGPASHQGSLCFVLTPKEAFRWHVTDGRALWSGPGGQRPDAHLSARYSCSRCERARSPQVLSLPGSGARSLSPTYFPSPPTSSSPRHSKSPSGLSPGRDAHWSRALVSGNPWNCICRPVAPWDALTPAIRNASLGRFGGSQAALNGNSPNCGQFSVIGGICRGIPACRSRSFMPALISTSLQERQNAVVISNYRKGQRGLDLATASPACTRRQLRRREDGWQVRGVPSSLPGGWGLWKPS